MKKSRKKRKFKKIVILISIIIMAFIIKSIFNNKINELLEKRLTVEEEIANIDELYIYGRNLNINGKLSINDLNFQKVNLILYNNEFKYYELNYDINAMTINYYLSDKLNGGIILDEIRKSKYYMFIELDYGEEQKKYYRLKNNTNYENTEYYTFSKYNNKMTILSEDSYPTMIMNVESNKDNNIYDIVIDPGHGGLDGGASNGEYKESTLTFDISSLLKNKLEAKGFKVKMTHDGNIPNNETMNNYDENGRAVIPQKLKAKYLLSIHLNSSSANYVNGLEIYTAKNIDYTLSKAIADNLVNEMNINYSKNNTSKIENGIYSRNLTNKDINDSILESRQKNRVPYDFSTNSNYYYMIRETGGIITGAYIDDRNKDTVGYNPYYNSNVGVESYILELGYITNDSELTNIINKKELYADNITNTIDTFINTKKEG